MRQRRPHSDVPVRLASLETLEPRLLLAATTYGNGGNPWTVPASGVVRIEAENFNQGGEGVGYHDLSAGNSGGAYRTGDSVDIEASGVASNGYDITSMDPGEWLEYTVNVATAGIYNINLRAARADAGGATVLISSASDSSRQTAVAGTGGAQTFGSNATQLELWAGTQVIRVQITSGALNLDYLEVGNRSATSQPYTSDWQPWAIASDRISWVEIENFDRGGEGIGYHDTTTANQGGKYRTHEGVDIEGPGAAMGNTYNIGYVTSGEYLNYTINVAQAGDYQLRVRASTATDNHTLRVLFGGVDKTGTLTVPNTGGYNTFTDVTATVTLSAGVQVMQFQSLSSNFNLDFISLQPVSTLGGEQPYGDARGLPAVLTTTGITRIEAEYYDYGGEGLGYHQINAKQRTANLNGQPFRPADAVSTENAGTGIDVCYWGVGEWTQYTIFAPTAGTYEMRLNYARGDAGNSNFTITDNGVSQGTVQLPTDSSWTTFTTVTTTVSLAAGKNVLRFTSSVGQINFDYFELNTARTFGNNSASWVIPTSGAVRIEAENFDVTTTGSVDTTGGNSGTSTYRPGTDVDLSPTGDTSGSIDVVNIAAGESLTYTINASSTSYYLLRLRVSSPSGGSLRVLFDGVDRTGLVTLPAAGGYQTVQVRPIFMSGWQTMQIQFVTGGFNLNWLELQQDTTAAVLADPSQLGSYAAEPPSAALGSVGDLFDRVYNTTYDWVNRPAGAPVPTNDWWTNILESTFAGGLWPYPLKAGTATNGVTMTYYNGIAVTAGNVNPSGGQTLRVTGPTDAFTRDALVNYGDWTVQFRMEQSSTSYMDVTMGRGLPYMWYEYTNLSPVLYASGGSQAAYSATGTSLTGTFTTDHFRIDHAGQQFGVFAPAGTQFVASGDHYTVTFSGADKYLVIAALPDATNATLDLFYQHAYAIPRGSLYNWSYSAAAGAVTTTWDLSTVALKVGASLDTIQGWLPHNYRDIISGPALLSTYQYPTIQGPVKLTVGHSFTIVQPSTGVNDLLPAPQSIGGTADYSAAQMTYYLQKYATDSASKLTYGNDTYWGGKDVQQYAEFALMAKTLGDTTDYNTFLTALRTACTDWFTYTPGETAHYFAYYPDAKALIGFNPAYGSENFTDNHFHYGYEVVGAAVLAMLDPTWAANYSAMVTMVAKQYANWDRTDTRLPFLRTFEPWSGHSYAGGTGDARGNNQESTSEAIQSWLGIILLGQALNDPTMTAAGMMGYTLESKAELEYWFDAPHQDLFSQMGYARSNVGINYDDWKGFATFFGANPEYVLGIEAIPIWPALDFLGKYPAAMQQSINLMLQQRTVSNADPTDNTWASFETGGNNDWLNINLGIQSQFDPQAAAQEWARMWGTGPSGTATATAENAQTGLYYYQDQSLRTYGVRDWNFHLSLPVGGVYTNTATGHRTYTVYNPNATAQTVQVLDSSNNVIDSFTAAPRVHTTVTVDVPNNPPTLSGIEGAALAYTENDPAKLLTAALTGANSDGTTLAGATVQITGNYQFGQDVLSFTPVGNITGAFNAITGWLLLSGTDTVANYQAALRSVKYQNTSDNPSTATRTVTFLVDDAVDNSNSVSRTITLTATNDPPTLSGIEAAALAYTENAAATAITATLVPADVDNTNLSGATVQITGGYINGQDVLSFINANGITGLWDPVLGKLTLAGSTSVANYQTALRAVMYRNTSDNPSAATRTVSFTVSDTALASNTVTRTVAITAVNDAPTLSGIEGSALAYTENAAATAITAALVAADVDSTNLSSATVQITGNYVNGQDVLSFTNTANITGVWSAASGLLTLSGPDTVANYQAALRNVKFQSSSTSGLARTVSFIVNDGAAASNTATRNIAITVGNAPPLLAGIEGTALAYTENAAATAITAALTASDSDSPNLSSATVQITGNYVNGQDVLSFTNTANITGVWSAASGLLTLSGPDTVANYQAALRSVKYQNTSENPSTATRTVSFTVNDGAATSNTATRTIAVTAVNDAPTLSGIEGAALAYTQGDPAAAITAIITAADIDNLNLSGATVQITGNYQNGQDVLSFTNTANITGVWSAASGLLTLAGPDTVANYQAALRNVKFQSSSPTALARTVSFIVNDGTANSSTVTRTITVTATSTQWTGAADNHWENAANWTAGVVPGATVTAVFDGSPTSRQPILYENESVKGVDIRTAGWTVSLSGHTLSVGDGGLSLAGGSSPTSSIDLGTGNLIVANPAADPNLYRQIQGWVASAWGSVDPESGLFLYDGHGLTSTAVAADRDHFGIGVVDNAFDGLDWGRDPLTEFQGVPVVPNDILARFTTLGDMDLGGSTNKDDYDMFKHFYGKYSQPGHGGLTPDLIGWQTGDFNIDGAINKDDYDLFKAGYGWSAAYGPLSGGDVTPLDVITPSPAGSSQGVVDLLRQSGGEAALAADTALLVAPADATPASLAVQPLAGGTAADPLLTIAPATTDPGLLQV